MTTSFKHDNLEAIKKQHPDLLDFITKGCNKSSIDLIVEKSRNGDPTLSAIASNKARIYLHSKYNPVKEAEKVVAAWQVKNTDSNILILGFGLGYLPIALLEKLDPIQNLFIVEPSIEIFQYGVEHVNLLSILNRPNTKFFVGSDFLNKIKKHFLETDFKTIFFTHQPSLRLFPELEEAVSYLETITLTKLKKELGYPKFKTEKPRVLIFETGFFIEREFRNNLIQQDISYISVSVKGYGEVGDADFIRRLMKALIEFKPDFIFCVNQWGFDIEGKLTELLTHYEVPFVCWYVDNPLPLLSRKNNNASEYGLYLLWDDYYIDQMEKLGFPNVEHLPYAVDSTIFYPPPQSISKKYPVSFVGNSLSNILQARLKEISNESYLMEVYNKLTQNNPPSLSGNKETIDFIKKEIEERKFPNKIISSLEVAINSKWTQDRRVRALLAIEEFKPHIFGDKEWKKLLPPSFYFHSEVNYHKELPEIYRITEINLNISNVQLRNSVNQRVFDVCACGSFLLTDRSLAVQQFLVSGESIETFESCNELRKKVGYFLNHPEEREDIARKGGKAILEKHTYMHRFKEILSLLKKCFA